MWRGEIFSFEKQYINASKKIIPNVLKKHPERF